jgi:hypothetical protein
MSSLRPDTPIPSFATAAPAIDERRSLEDQNEYYYDALLKTKPGTHAFSTGLLDFYGSLMEAANQRQPHHLITNFKVYCSKFRITMKRLKSLVVDAANAIAFANSVADAISFAVADDVDYNIVFREPWMSLYHYKVVLDMRLYATHLLPPRMEPVLQVIMTEVEMTSMEAFMFAVQRQLDVVWRTLDGRINEAGRVPIFDREAHSAFQYLCLARAFLLKDKVLQHQRRLAAKAPPTPTTSPTTTATSPTIPGPTSTKVCDNGGCTQIAVFKCPCRNVRYCCRSCQKSQWSVHKLVCPLVWND